MTFTRNNKKVAPHHNHLVQASTHCPLGLCEETKGHVHKDRVCWETWSSKHRKDARGRLCVQMGLHGKHTPWTPHGLQL